MIPIDDSSLDYENEFVPCISNVVMITDDVYLQDIWIATCERNLSRRVPYQKDIEFVKDMVFDHEPTKNELIQFMCANECGLYDLVSVEKGYRLMMREDE